MQDVKSEVLTVADKIILNPTPLITEKEIIPPSGDKRDYVSLSPYFYKVEGGKLEMRDGEINPEVEKYSDPERLSKATRNIFITALASISSENKTDKEKYAQYAVSTIDDWFVNEETRMTPSLEYAQMKQGETTGNHYGIIDGVGLIRVIESVDHLKKGGLIDQDTQKGVENWFEQYLKWLNESEKGQKQKNMENNHGTFYDVQVAYIADFLGKEEMAKEAIESSRLRIESQINTDGVMPHETKRAMPYDYQLFNLYGFSEIATLGEKYDIDLWNYETEDGRGLKKAFEFFTEQLKEKDDNPFKINRAGELYYAYRAASKAYGNKDYWDLPKKYYNDPLVDKATSQIFSNNVIGSMGSS